MSDDQTGLGPDRDLWALTGLTVIAACAAVMSFAAWSGLAGQVGMVQHAGPVRLAWLLPLSIDAYAMVATRVWLMDRTVSDRTTAYARRTAVAAIALSFAGNALYHLVTVLHMQARSGWWVYVVAVSGLPAVQFGQAVHLIVRMRSDQRSGPDRTLDQVGSSVAAAAPSAQPARPDRTVRPVSRTGQARLDQVRREWPDRLPTKAAVMRLTDCGSQTALNTIRALRAEREADRPLTIVHD